MINPEESPIKAQFQWYRDIPPKSMAAGYQELEKPETVY